MPHNDKLFRDSAYGQDVSPQGIGQTNILESSAYYQDANQPQNTPDPLTKTSQAANKPGSSIPSIFGRMMFFKTALKNTDIHAPATSKSVYDKIVSEWLDLLEGIFKRSYRYKFIAWDRTRQLDRLSNQHGVLKDALENQINKFFGDMLSNLYIIKDNTGKLVGATSPYTLVFTAPGYRKNRNVGIVPLLRRDRQFRLMMYRIFMALNSNAQIPTQIFVQINTNNGPVYNQVKNPAYEIVKDLCDYIKRNSDKEPDQQLLNDLNASAIGSIAAMTNFYDPVMTEAAPNAPKVAVSIAELNSSSQTQAGTTPYIPGPLGLYVRRASTLDSDFYIDADAGLQPAVTKPMVLPNVTAPIGRTGRMYEAMRYYDDALWTPKVLCQIRGIENATEQALELPGGDGVRHVWLSAASFLEPKLLRLPYRMDPDKFKSVINDGFHSYLLPLKPLAMKYFGIDTILNGRPQQGQGFKWSKLDDYTIECRLDIPVADRNGQNPTYVTLVQTYNLTDDVLEASPAMEYPVSVGITPFVQIDAEQDNRYNVMLHYGEPDNAPVSGVQLEFYNGSAAPIADTVKTFDVIDTGNNVYQRLYKVLGTKFNALRVIHERVGDSPVGGMVIPSWFKPTPGMVDVFYGIDFGTTNTHIAYAIDNQKTESFNTEELKQQCVYLAEKQNIKDRDVYLSNHTQKDLNLACENIYGNVSLATQEEQARRFFPNFELNQYSFPIRTAAFGTSRNQQELFDDFAIGYHFNAEKSAIFSQRYITSLKWDLDNGKPLAEERVKLVFCELLMLVRNHWLHVPNVNMKGKPHIALTFPLAMQTARMFEIWAEAYAEVFAVPVHEAQNNYLIKVSESLAPAHRMIASGAYTTSGMLNVDIGGGTTDIQYFRQSGGMTIAPYNSEKFAGDDLWGCGRENMPLPPRTIKDNIFTRHAAVVMEGASIEVGTNTVSYSEIQNLKLDGKDHIGRLLRDKKNRFANNITGTGGKAGRNNQALKVAFLHYSALMYHIAKWVMGHPRMREKFPELINFSGYGSKYIEILFGPQQLQHLTEFTRALLAAYGVAEADRIKVNFEAANPKCITAEGAVIYSKLQMDGSSVITPVNVYNFGYAGSDCRKSPTFKEAADPAMVDKVMTAFDEYIDGFCKAREACGTVDIPQLTDYEKVQLRGHAQAGYSDIANGFLQSGNISDDSRVQQSLFIWALKDALYNFDEYTQK